MTSLYLNYPGHTGTVVLMKICRFRPCGCVRIGQLYQRVFPSQEHNQCDQMARYFFNIWPFAKTKNYHKSIKVGQIRFKILPNTNPPKKLLKNFKILPKRWNFAKSAHTIMIVSIQQIPSHHGYKIFFSEANLSS